MEWQSHVNLSSPITGLFTYVYNGIERINLFALSDKAVQDCVTHSLEPFSIEGNSPAS